MNNVSKNKVIVAAVAALLIVCMVNSCGGEDEAPASSETTSSPKEAKESSKPKAEKKDSPKKKSDGKSEGKDKPKKKGDSLATKVDKTFTTNFGMEVKDTCDYTDMTWHCFFDGYKDAPGDRVEVHLSLPGDLSDHDQKQFAEQARLHTFNFVGDEVESLDAITSFNNGVDSGTTYRHEVPLLNM